MDQEKFTFDKNKIKKGLYISLIIGVGLAIAVAFFFMIFNSKGLMENIRAVVKILRPFIIGAVIAYILKPTCNAYEKFFTKRMEKAKRRKVKNIPKKANLIAVVLTYISWIVIIGGLLWITIPQIYQSISKFIGDIPEHYEKAYRWFQEFKTNNPKIGAYADQGIAAVKEWTQSEEFESHAVKFGSSVIMGVVDFIGVIFDIAVGLIISVFFLSGRKTLAKKATFLVHCIFKEKHANAIIKEVKFADRMFGGFLEGKIIDSAIIGILYLIFVSIVGIKYGALIALICGVTNIIPFFGPFLGAIPSGCIILMTGHSPWQLLAFIIFVCVIQFIDGNIIDPHIVGGNIQISPFCVIFAVLFFGGLWGFWGLLIGVPTFAVLQDIFKKIMYSRMLKKGKKDILKAHLSEFGKKPRKKATEGASANFYEVANEDGAAPEENTTSDNKTL